MNSDAFVALVRENQDFLVTCHRRPDADALGSALGLTAILRGLGKDVVTFCPERLPESISFLVGSADVVCEIPPDSKFDVTVVADTASRTLVPDGLPPRQGLGTVVVIDHHAAFDDFADLILRDASASSTAEIVAMLADALGVSLTTLDTEAARAIYAGIVADTGGFRFACTTPTVLRLGASLLERGVDPWEVAYRLFENWSPARFALLREVLSNTTFELSGKLAMMKVTEAMLQQTGAEETMVDGLVGYGRSVSGVEIAALITELDATVCKVSFRSKGRMDVSTLAKQLGGGGHRAAAATRIDGTFDDVCEQVRKVCAAALKAG